MALIPKLSFCSSKDCLRLQVTDQTGAYSTSNLGGWGAPNDTLASVVSAVIKVLLPGSSVGDEVYIDVGSELPNSTYQYKTLKSQDFGLGTDIVLVDGTYVIDYTVVTSGGTYTFHTEFLMTCSKCACVNSMFAKVASTGCDCDENFVTEATQAFVVLQMIEYAALCQKTSEVAKLETLLNKICKAKDNCFSCD